MGQGLREDECWLDLTSGEAALLTRQTGRGIASGPLVLSRAEADDIAWKVAKSFDHKGMAPDGIPNPEGTWLILLVSRLGDNGSDRALRLRALSGDGQAAFELGMRKFGGPLLSYPLDAVVLLRQAYGAGIRAAGYELAQLNARQSGLPRQERITLLEELALDGDPSAALEILHMPGQPMERARLLQILAAVRDNSAEASEWYDRLVSEAGEG